MNKKRLAIFLIFAILLISTPVHAKETQYVCGSDGFSIGYEGNWAPEITSATDPVIHSMDENWDEMTKAAYLANWLSHWTAYDYDNARGNGGQSTYDAIIKKKAVCAGYTNAYTYLMNKAGLFCIPIHNNAMGHAWNMVRLNNKYYFIDMVTIPNRLSKKDDRIPIFFSPKSLREALKKVNEIYMPSIIPGRMPDDNSEINEYEYGKCTEPTCGGTCDIYDKIKFDDKYYTANELSLASGNDANNYKVRNFSSYYMTKEGSCIRWTDYVPYNGCKHTGISVKKTKNNSPDIEVHIYNNDGSEIDPSSYKLKFHKELELYHASFTIEWNKNTQPSDPKLADSSVHYMYQTVPADLSTLNLTNSGVKIKNGTPKIKKLSYTNEFGRKIKLKYSKNKMKTDYTATVSDNVIVLEGKNNYRGTVTIPMS